MISQETIQSVKNIVSTLDVVGSFVKLKKKGVDYVGSCPFHNEKTPSFTISPVKNIYKCFGCGKSGNGITFLMEHEGKSYVEAIKWVAEKNNINVEEVGMIKQIKKPLPRLEKVSKDVIDYFGKRGISNNTLLRFKITESLEWMPKAQGEVKSICFNYYRDEQLVNIKFRAKNKDFKMSKDAELIFYNLDSIKNEKICYITEGEIDCMSLYEVGIFNAVSVPNGASATHAAKLEYLDNCFEYFLDKTKVILVVDNDTAGKKLEEELARRIGYEKCYLVKYPDKCKDANEVLVKYGKETLINVLENSKRYPLYGEITIDDMYETLNDFFFEGYPEGFACKVSDSFDEHLKFYPGQLTIVTGIPGSGKSEFVDWIMTGLAKHHSWNFGICSFECPPEIHVTKLAEKITNKAFAFRSNHEHRMSQSEFEKSLFMINSHFHFMNLSLIDITIDGIISKAEEFVKRYGINGFLFDPWNCIEAKEDTTNYILQCLNKLINFLEKYKVHGFLVAHPTKLKKDLQTKKYVIPNLYDISGSAHFFNRTHNGISIYRDFETNQVDIYFQKVKWSWLGKLGYSSYSFNKDTRAYSELL
jgi:twinkle protein